jgi:hypothetical protein
MGSSKPNRFQGSCKNLSCILSVLVTGVRALFAGTIILLLFASAAEPGLAQIAADVTVSKDSSSSSTTIASPAFSTAGPNELLLAFVAADYISGTNTTVKSIAGGSLTWTLVKRTNAQSGTSEIWRAFAAAPLAGATVTATLSQSVASSITIMSFSGVSTTGTNGSGAIGAIGGASAKPGAPSASLVTTGVGSWVLGVGNDFDNATARTLGAGQTLVHQYLTTTGDTYWVQRLSAPVPTAGTTVTISDTAPTKDRYNLSIVEVLATSGVAPTWTLSGSITPANLGTGATVTLGGASSATTTADSNGNYSFTGLANGSYTVTPTKSGISFSPANQPVTINGANQSGINFTAQTVTYTISGNISPASLGTGAMVTLGGASSETTTADSNGNYSFTGLANGSYTVTPTKSGISFSPANKPVTINGANQSAVNFTAQAAAYGISGTITPASLGTGATVALGGASSATTTADSNGNYSFTGLANGSYTVTPTKSGTSFSPLNQSVVVSGASQSGINFTAQATSTYTISGNISPSAGGGGATVSLSGAATGTSSADANGNFSFSQLANGNYTVTPSKNGFIFTPPSQAVSVSGADVDNIDFTASAQTNSITMDAKVSVDGTSASATIGAPPFNTAANNELLLALISTDYLSGANTTVKSVSGGGLTWTLVTRANGQSGSSEIWRAFATEPMQNVSVSATLSQSVISSMTVVSLAGVNSNGADGSGAIGAVGNKSAASGAPTASLVTTGNNSWVLGVGNDYDNAVTRSVPTGQTLLHQDLTSAGDTYWVQMLSGAVAGAGTTATINDTAPTKDRYNLAIVEVLAASGGTNTTPPTVSMTAPASGATVAGKTTLAADASDPVAVAGVQFLLDGSPLGAEVTSAPYTLIWDTTTTSDGSHTLEARARDSAGLSTVSSAIPVTVQNSSNLSVVGQWSSVYSLPAVAVNLVLLKNNKVLFYQDGASATVWDYANNSFNSVPISVDLFCSGHALLADGRVMVVGGYGSSNPIGLANAEIFDPAADTWTPVPNMQYRRWYPTATTLSDGRILVTAGWQTTAHTNAGISEIYDPSTNGWTSLTNANNPFETYPFLYLLPDGRIIHIGGSEYATDTDVLDLNTVSWSVIDPNIVDGGSATMYLPGKFMKAGSATDSQNSGPSSNTTFVLDMTQPSPAWKQTASMAYPRSFLNLTMLPDGNVLATGGETDRNGGTIANAVYPAEMWSPDTQTWSTMASMHTPREYHGTALLLPDGRVLVSGMGADFGNVPDEKSAEFYSPPYLFKGARPTITQAPSAIQHNTSFFVGTPDAASIAKVALIRTGAVTHFFDENERYLPLTFSQTTGGLNVTAPIDANLAPPGIYMLFIVNSNGVPSVAPFVQVQ